MKILIVEDDKRLARLIERVLREELHTVDVSHDGESGLDLLLHGQYDVAIIDWMLPARDGPSLCRAARLARIPTALLILTARGQIEDKVLGFESGADDYLVKPFAFEELLARVRALGRRFNLHTGTDELRIGSIVLDLRSYTGRRGERPLDLTPTEWRLLEFLMRHPGQTLTRQQILDYVWSFEREVQLQMVDVYISYLRRKLNAAGESDPIVTVRGVGYRLEANRA
ncbi:response regulator transcription factor [Chloroflexus sp.]|uniref:response regulator transcription factor n=1 Tax=Chloroflexus sp. TaxID=1904827 RepID=UPI0026052253|nr:response regulator transcription factor [uncultured Chloroflexus sp.]